MSNNDKLTQTIYNLLSDYEWWGNVEDDKREASRGIARLIKEERVSAVNEVLSLEADEGWFEYVKEHILAIPVVDIEQYRDKLEEALDE